MRFPGHQIAAVRSGKITTALRPFKGPSGFRVGHYFALERIDDVATPWEELDERQQAFWAKCGAGPGAIVQVPTATTLEGEWVEITARSRAVLDEAADELAPSCGYESGAELVDVFCTDRGGPAWQRVWVFDFVKAEAPHFLHGLVNEPEAIDQATLARYVSQNQTFDALREERRREKYAKRTLRERSEIEAEAQRLGLGRQLARAHAAMDALEREVRRKRAA